MRLTCPTCGATYAVEADALPPGGSHVQCSACHTRWFAKPEGPAPERLSEDQIIARLEARPGPRLSGGTEAGPSPQQPAAAPIAFPGSARPPAAPPAPALSAPAAAGVEASEREPAAHEFAAREPQRQDPGSREPAAQESALLAAAAMDADGGEPAARGPREPVAENSVRRAAVREAPAAPLAPTPLRPRQAAERMTAAAASPGPPRARASRFAPGLLTAIALAGAAFSVYLRAEDVAARAPAAAPVVSAYAEAIDEARVWIEARLGPLRDRLTGG